MILTLPVYSVMNLLIIAGVLVTGFLAIGLDCVNNKTV